jgi:hypothetical protein
MAESDKLMVKWEFCKERVIELQNRIIAERAFFLAMKREYGLAVQPLEKDFRLARIQLREESVIK